MIKEVAFVKFTDFSENYMSVYNRTEVSTIEEATTLIESLYPGIEFTLEVQGNEIYVVSEEQLPCKNCE